MNDKKTLPSTFSVTALMALLMHADIHRRGVSMSTPHVRPGLLANQRRSQRILLSVPLKVSGKRTNGTKFEEFTSTLIVNAHGALIQLRERVSDGALVEIRNIKTGEELVCKVVDIAEGANGVLEIGVEFSVESPRFWRVSFPPADWSRSSPEAKKFSSGPTIAKDAKPTIAKK
jgi:hypothetical protein